MTVSDTTVRLELVRNWSATKGTNSTVEKTGGGGSGGWHMMGTQTSSTVHWKAEDQTLLLQKAHTSHILLSTGKQCWLQPVLTGKYSAH